MSHYKYAMVAAHKFRLQDATQLAYTGYNE